MLDAPDPTRPSYRAHTDDLPLTARGMQWYWGLYVPDAVGAVHGDVFTDVRPAATMVVVKALLRDEWRVEIEAEALVRHA